MFTKSLALRILAVNFLLIVLPLITYLLFLFDTDYNERIADDIKRLRNVGFARADYLNLFIDDQFLALDIFNELSGLDNPQIVYDRTPQFVKMASLIDRQQIGFFVREPNDHYIVKYSSVPSFLGEDLSFRGFVQGAVVNGRSAYLYIDFVTLLPEFITTKAIHSRENFELLGVLAATYPADQIIHKLIDTQYFANQETISLLTEDKIIFSSSNPDLNFSTIAPLSEERIAALKENQQFGKSTIPKKTISLEPFSNLENVFLWKDHNVTHIVTVIPVANKSLYIMLDVDRATITARYAKDTWDIIAILFGITFLSCLITLFVSWFISRALHELIAVMDRISQGDLSVRFRQRTLGFEINEAGETLNQMLGQLIEFTDKANQEKLKTEVVAKELRLGHDIQQSILPHNIPDTKGIEVGIFSKFASDVGGDFHDVYPLRGRLMMALSDSSGKGLMACLYSVGLRSMLRSFADKSDDLAEVLKKTSDLFYKDLQHSSLLVKALIAAWNPKSGKLSYAPAGPAFGFIRRSSKAVEPLAGSSNPVGSRRDSLFSSYELSLEPGDIVVFYTAGIVDQGNAEGAFYGEEELRKVVNTLSLKRAKEIAEGIREDISQFVGGAPQTEDMTVIVLKRI